jgi:hypothetical protein
MHTSVLPLILMGSLLAAAGPAAPAPTEGQLVAEAATFGAVAQQATLCGLRDAGWAEDLRLSALQSHADHGQLVAALGYGDMEASEDLAADTPAVVCPQLKVNPALKRADEAVEMYRQAKTGKPVG